MHLAAEGEARPGLRSLREAGIVEIDMEEMAMALQQLRLLSEQQAAQIAALQAGSGSQPRVVVQNTDDMRLGKPGNFKGDEQAFDDWDVKFRAWLGSQDRTITEELLVWKALGAERPLEELSPEVLQRAAKVHFALIMLTEDAALRIVRGAGANGNEGYRLLCKRYDLQSKSRSSGA